MGNKDSKNKVGAEESKSKSIKKKNKSKKKKSKNSKTNLNLEDKDAVGSGSNKDLKTDTLNENKSKRESGENLNVKNENNSQINDERKEQVKNENDEAFANNFNKKYLDNNKIENENFKPETEEIESPNNPIESSTKINENVEKEDKSKNVSTSSSSNKNSNKISKSQRDPQPKYINKKESANSQTDTDIDNANATSTNYVYQQNFQDKKVLSTSLKTHSSSKKDSHIRRLPSEERISQNYLHTTNTDIEDKQYSNCLSNPYQVEIEMTPPYYVIRPSHVNEDSFPDDANGISKNYDSISNSDNDEYMEKEEMVKEKRISRRRHSKVKGHEENENVEKNEIELRDGLKSFRKSSKVSKIELENNVSKERKRSNRSSQIESRDNESYGNNEILVERRVSKMKESVIKRKSISKQKSGFEKERESRENSQKEFQKEQDEENMDNNVDNASDNEDNDNYDDKESKNSDKEKNIYLEEEEIKYNENPLDILKDANLIILQHNWDNPKVKFNGGFERGDQYDIRLGPTGNRVLSALEQNVKCACCCLSCCRSDRSFTIKILDYEGNEYLTVKRNCGCKCWSGTFGDVCCHHIEVYSSEGVLIGKMKQKCSCCSWCVCSKPRYFIEIEGQRLLMIKGESCMFCCCKRYCCQGNFTILSSEEFDAKGQKLKEHSDSQTKSKNLISNNSTSSRMVKAEKKSSTLTLSDNNNNDNGENNGKGENKLKGEKKKKKKNKKSSVKNKSNKIKGESESNKRKKGKNNKSNKEKEGKINEMENDGKNSNSNIKKEDEDDEDEFEYNQRVLGHIFKAEKLAECKSVNFKYNNLWGVACTFKENIDLKLKSMIIGVLIFLDITYFNKDPCNPFNICI